MGFAGGDAAGAGTLADAAVEVATTVEVLPLDAAAQSFEGRNISIRRQEPPIRLIASIIVLNSQSGPGSRMSLTEIMSGNTKWRREREKEKERGEGGVSEGERLMYRRYKISYVQKDRHFGGVYQKSSPSRSRIPDVAAGVLGVILLTKTPLIAERH